MAVTAAKRDKAKELLLSSQLKDSEAGIGFWDFEGGEAELVVGHVDDGGKREVCQGVLAMLMKQGFAMVKGYEIPEHKLPPKTANWRFDTPIGGMQEAFYLRINAKDLEAICTAIKKSK